jgi:hypothetical protein
LVVRRRRLTVILIWRGWGLLAVVALFPLLASCAGLITIEPMWIFMLAASLSLLFAGAVCLYCGTRWNRNGVEHSFYEVPLEVWGWVYLAADGLFSVAAMAGAIKQGLDKPRWLYQGITAVIGLVVIVAAGVTLRRLARQAVEGSGEGGIDATDRMSEPGAPWERPDAESGAAPNRGG